MINNTNASIHTGQTTVAAIKHSMDLESDRIRIEQLASKRSELQAALQIITNASTNSATSDSSNDGMNAGNFMSMSDGTTTTTQNNPSPSFFFMEKEDAKSILEYKLKKVEMELIELCNEVQRNMNS
jgi:hypothetical protein